MIVCCGDTSVTRAQAREELIPAGLFDEWKTVKQVQDYCSEQYGYAYPSATGTLNTAVNNGLLKQHRSASAKAYRKG